VPHVAPSLTLTQLLTSWWRCRSSSVLPVAVLWLKL
jgi:hypothetical protein